MEEPNLARLTIYYSLAIGGALTLLGFLLRKPLERLGAFIGGDADRGFKAIFLVSLVFYVIVAVVMSYYVAWRIMHGAGPFGFPLPQDMQSETASPSPEPAAP